MCPPRHGPHGRGGEDTAGIDEDFCKAGFHGFFVNRLGARNDDTAHTVGNFAAFEDFCRIAKSSKRPLVQEPMTT